MQITVSQWIEMMRQEQNQDKKRREQLLFDIATFVMGRAKFYAKENFGRGIGGTARTAGRSGALMRSIELARIDDKTFVVTAGGPGVPYAGIHEYGTVGKGGLLPSIRPKNPNGALTVPLLPQYVGRRAREFPDLHVVKPEGSKFAFLANYRNELAYILLKRVDIKPRPYLEPATKDVAKEANLMARVRLIFGDSKVPYQVTKISKEIE